MARKARYFPQKPVLRWLGEPVSAPPNMRKTRDLLPFYSAFSLDELTAEVGDFVIIKSDSGNDDLLECDVARLDGLYEDCSLPQDSCRAVVTWLCRPSLLPPQTDRDAFKEQGAPPLDDRLDLVLEARNYEANISAESIYFKCNVFAEPITTKPESFIKRCPPSKFPNYILRFKMKPVKGHSKKFTLEPYKDGRPSPLKLSSKSPLKEVKYNRRRDVSPISISPKLMIPKELNYDVNKVVRININKSNLSVKKRRLSSAENSRENTPVKKTKKSESVPVSPEIEEAVLKTPSRGGARATSRTATPASRAATPASKATTSATKVEKGLDGGYWGKDSPKRTPKQKKRWDDGDTDPKPASGRVAKTPKTPKREETKSTKKKTTTKKADKAEKRLEPENKLPTHITTATGSGRKVTLKLFEEKKRIAPSSGLGDNQISSMLQLSDDEFEEEASQLEKKPARTAKSKSAKTDPAAKKRVRRASMSAVQKTPEKPVVNRRKSLAVSETKVRTKKVELIETDSSGSEFESEEDSSEDDDDFEIKKKSVKAVKAKPAVKPSKSGALLMHRREFFPGVAQREKPVRMSSNPLVEAQERLHVSAVPDSLPCREDEFAEVFGYIEGKLQEGTGGCIYISGVPGTGKTATVKQVMRYMEENRDEFPDFNFYELNGMRLTCPEQIYVEMWRKLTGEKLVHEQAMKKLDHRFATSAPKRVHTIFLVDELDMLCKKKQTVLYNIFEWPSRPQGKIVIIAIANTMDLPERDMDLRVISRLGFNRLHFAPYNQLQLQQIVSSRLDGLSVFQSDELQLVARKVASLSGDCRRALDICRILAERAEREGRDRVTSEDVLKVHKEMFSSLKIQFIRGCSRLEQFFLRSMVSEFYKTGVEETQLRSIYARMEEVCASEGASMPPLQAIYDISARLSSQRLILSEDYRKGLDTKLRLNVGFEDINFALKPRSD